MFTPIETSVGAVLLHQATSVLLYQNGSILGASGLLRKLFAVPSKETIAFFAGMAMSFLPLKLFLPELLPVYPSAPSSVQACLTTVGIGLLVGLGTKLSNGCTSGHMLCGLARLSGRSLIAVATFFPIAILTHHLAHPSIYTEACPVGTPCYTATYPPQSTIFSIILLAASTILAAQIIPRIIARTESQESKSYASPARQATQFFSGLEFGLGLHISGMSNPSKTLGFLSFPKLDAWDPSLALVMLFGVLPNMIEIQSKGFKNPPAFDKGYNVPTKTIKDTDWKFVLGAAMFGVGWGLCGVCPGPAALRSVAQPLWGALWMAGFWLGGKLAF
ncbi:YeeE/YedE family integral membrane protein-like protein [Delitschia confertaspora ATCC 74209]|uniref:YeeE/YedE family integral membrane protein-like protein n=1 Tax=Delitschia confertaspora ATCC 74209 TaxID=1513339 RepID=A0A9P4JWJ3_9PLEO|nr:YeeE/YedE family integral membrane protein-like protein [Delitschia confertaspora ATCC 74209]